MVPKAAAVTVSSIKNLLTRIGSATSGKKDVLLTRLSRDVSAPKMHAPSSQRDSSFVRILSIDMGIKNLAYCVANVKVDTLAKDPEDASIPMHIEAWRCLNVVDEVLQISSQTHNNLGETAKIASVEKAEADDSDPYTPSALSRTAHHLVTKTFLTYRPDVILIERQRWRSAGGPSIQQWTVRVNTLEGMLWALFIAFRSSSSLNDSATKVKEYAVQAVDPKRVGAFWVGQEVQEEVTKKGKSRTRKVKVEDEMGLGEDGEVEVLLAIKGKNSGTKAMSRGKIEKKAKIDLLRSWLTKEDPGTAESSPRIKHTGEETVTAPAISFTFSPEAADTKEQLLVLDKRGRLARSKRQNVVGFQLKKMDDVTDCFLQAAAWVAWEGNRVKIEQEWDSEQNSPKGSSTDASIAKKASKKRSVKSKTEKPAARRKKK